MARQAARRSYSSIEIHVREIEIGPVSCRGSYTGNERHDFLYRRHAVGQIEVSIKAHAIRGKDHPNRAETYRTRCNCVNALRCRPLKKHTAHVNLEYFDGIDE